MNTELMAVDIDRDLSVRRPPDVVLAEAKEAAVALKNVLDAKPNKVMMNDEVYLEFEDWQTIGRFYGLTVKVTGTRPVTFGDVMGFEAEAVVLHNASGQEISRAEGMCLNDEEKWSSRPKYEWVYVKKSGGHSVDDPGKDEMIWMDNPKKPGKKMPKRERIKTGDDRVPLFQLRSMAQTRACAKAFRNVLAWVVVMAGYKPTPAEELPDAQEPVTAKSIPAAGEDDPSSAQPTSDEITVLLNVFEATPLGQSVLRPILRNFGLADRNARPTAPDQLTMYVEALREQVDRLLKKEAGKA